MEKFLDPRLINSKEKINQYRTSIPKALPLLDEFWILSPCWKNFWIRF